LSDVCGGKIVAEKEDCHGGLSIGILAEDSTTKRGKKLRSGFDHSGLARRWLWIELLMEQMIVKVSLCGQSIQCPPVVFADSVNKDR